MRGRGGGGEGGGRGVAYPKYPNQIINVGTIGHTSAEDTRLLGGSGSMLPRKNF